jgi:hypothetical protein
LQLLGGYVPGTGSGTITWQITNLGTMDAKGILLIGHLPRGITLQKTSMMPVGFCEQSPAFDDSTRLACGLSTLPAGQSWTINVSIVANVATAITAARVKFTGIDSQPANNYVHLTMKNNIAGSSGSKTVLQIPALALANSLEESSSDDPDERIPDK